MEFQYFSRNGEVRPVSEAVVPLSSIEYAYGFGVYETIRVTKGKPRFLSDHIERLLSSAREIELSHTFSAEFVEKAIAELIQRNAVDACNLKILLIGGASADGALLFMQCLAPLFPDKKLYRDGAHCITVAYERMLPHAKTLNMLGSYLAYHKAKMADAYDALLVDSSGCITEGTRTNFFCIKGKTIFSPPESRILLGVTRKAVLEIAKDAGFSYQERGIEPDDLSSYEGAFLTSTSSKIIPLRSIDSFTFPPTPPALRELMDAFDRFLDSQ